jgi:hypothetical protein
MVSEVLMEVDYTLLIVGDPQGILAQQLWPNLIVIHLFKVLIY